MADGDRTIGQLPELAQLSDSAMLPVEQTGVAYHTTGQAWKSYVQQAIAGGVSAAEQSAAGAQNSAASASQYAANALAAQQKVEGMAVESEVLEAGAVPTLAKFVNSGSITLRFGLAPGAVGPQGSQGPRGLQGVQGPRGDTGTAVAVETAGMYYFHVDNDSSSPTFGHLFLTYSGSDAPNFSIDANGHLIWTVS